MHCRFLKINSLKSADLLCVFSFRDNRSRFDAVFVSAEIVDKIVSAARREIIYVVTNADVRRIVYKTIERSVTARNNYFSERGILAISSTVLFCVRS